MKATEKFFHVALFIMLHKMVLTLSLWLKSYSLKGGLNFWGWTTFEVWHKPFNCAFHQQRQQDASNSTENWKSIHCLQSWRKRKKIIHNKNIYTKIKMKSLFLSTNLDLGSEQQLAELNFAHPLLPPRILRDFSNNYTSRILLERHIIFPWLVKLINNSPNHHWFGYQVLISIDFDDFTSLFTPQFLF